MNKNILFIIAAMFVFGCVEVPKNSDMKKCNPDMMPAGEVQLFHDMLTMAMLQHKTLQIEPDKDTRKRIAEDACTLFNQTLLVYRENF